MLPGYLINKAVGTVLPGDSDCWNLFEWSAGFKDGGYQNCKGLGQEYTSEVLGARWNASGGKE
jgi:hypothetical protein